MGALKQVLADPRPDIRADAWLWEHLLMWAYNGEAEPSLFGALKGLRCGGARLALAGETVRLERGDWDELEYAGLRKKYLVPHAARLQKLLADLGPWAAGQERERAELRRKEHAAS